MMLRYLLILALVLLSRDALALNAGEQIALEISRLPATGGTVDATKLRGAQTITTDIFAGVTKSVKLMLGHATFTVSATQNVPSNAEIAGTAGFTDDGVITGGTQFVPTDALSGLPVFKYHNTIYTRTYGVAIRCFASGANGFLIDSSAAVGDAGAGISHDNQFDSVYTSDCVHAMTWGSTGAVGTQSDGITLRSFVFLNSVIGLRVNSQNAGQNSIVERGYFLIPAALAPLQNDGIRFDYAPLMMSIRNVSFAGDTNAIGIHVAYPNDSGGAPLYVEACDFEMQSTAKSIVVDVGSATNASFLFTSNSFLGAIGESVVEINAPGQVLSTTNNFHSGDALANADHLAVTSVGDFFRVGYGWLPTLGARLSVIGNNNGDTSDFGTLTVPSSLYAALPTSANGTILYCSDCAIPDAGSCSQGDAGALAKRIRGAWICE